jgi:hypothetical protein
MARGGTIAMAGVSVTSMALLGVGGWVALRIHTRNKTALELEEEGVLQQAGLAQGVADLFGVDLNIPPPGRLAETMVPIWSTNSPYTALDDILINGRESIYWPPEYREGSPLVALGLEKKLLALAAAKRGSGEA